MQLYICRGKSPLGPLSLENVRQQLSLGLISRNTPAWYEGCPTWVRLADINGVFPKAARATPIAITDAFARPPLPHDFDAPPYRIRSLVAATLFPPTGVVALVFSRHAQTYARDGRRTEAEWCSRMAKRWSGTSLAFFTATAIIYVIRQPENAPYFVPVVGPLADVVARISEKGFRP